MQPDTTDFVTLTEGVIASDYALKNLNKALGEAQNEFGSSVKDEVNAYHGYSYVPLANIIGAVRPSLTKHHLTVSQYPVTDLETKRVAIVTRLAHWDSGEWTQSTLELPGELALGKDGALKFNQQTIGGSITYGQKYAYKSIVGIADSEEEIDGNKGETADLPARPKAQPKPAAAKAKQAEHPPAQEAAAAAPSSRTAFFNRTKELGWGLAPVKTLLTKLYKTFDTSALSPEQLESALNIMSKGAPDEVIANLEPAEAA